MKAQLGGMRRPRACIVLPTYNEAENIKRHLDKILTVAKRLDHDLDILVVDDSSPDGTAGIVRAHRSPRIHLLLRTEKQGLGAAYIAGMKHALDTLDPDVIIEMDSDGQHDPEDLPVLLEHIADADMVIGSRYIDGGSIEEGWGVHRRITSTCARTITRIVLGLQDIKDCSGGFRAIRASILRRIDLDTLHVKGYAFQAVLLEAVLHHGGLVQEVPITFSNRTAGKSKMGIKDMIEGGTICFTIRAKRMLRGSRRMKPLPRRVY